MTGRRATIEAGILCGDPVTADRIGGNEERAGSARGLVEEARLLAVRLDEAARDLSPGSAEELRAVARSLRTLGRVLGTAGRSADSKADALPPGSLIAAELRDRAPRGSQILCRLIEGMSEKQIASVMRCSPHTVHSHVKRLYARFGVSSRSELLARFISRPLRVVLLTWMLLATASAGRGEERSIFDTDPVDQQPRPPAAKNEEPSPKPPATPAPPPKPHPAPPWPGARVPPKAEPPAKTGIPDAASVASSTRLLRDLYAREYRDPSPKGKRSLAGQLLALADATEKDPAGRFATLAEARRLGLECGDTATVKSADAKAAEWFSGDP